MKLTINVPDNLLRMILRDRLELSPAGIKKVMNDPRFHRAMQREAQIFYFDVFADQQCEFLFEIVFGDLRLADKYLKGVEVARRRG